MLLCILLLWHLNAVLRQFLIFFATITHYLIIVHSARHYGKKKLFATMSYQIQMHSFTFQELCICKSLKLRI